MVMIVNFDIFTVATCAVLLRLKASALSMLNEDVDGDIRDNEYDCRFWREPRQKMARRIMSRKEAKQVSVFYFWNTSAGECQPCTVCVENTLFPCTCVRDTTCISHQEWSKLGIKGGSALKDGGNSKDDGDEGVIVYKAYNQATKQPEVYGKRVYTDESNMKSNSPTRAIHQKYGDKVHGKKTDVSADRTFGKPTFYAKDSHKNRNHQNNEWPILAILRDVLNNNQIIIVSLKDLLLRNISDH